MRPEHRIRCLIALIPLIFGASFAFLKYAGWSAVYSGLYGLPSEVRRVAEADSQAKLYGGVVLGLAAIATVVTTIAIPTLEADAVPLGLNGVVRVALAIALVVASILITAAGISALGHYLK